MLMARAVTITIVASEANDSIAIKAFALGVSGMASVGENAVAFVKPK